MKKTSSPVFATTNQRFATDAVKKFGPSATSPLSNPLDKEVEVKITKKRDGDNWRISLAGRPSRFLLEKGRPRRWGEPQEWLITTDGRIALSATSASACISRLELIINEVLAHA